MAKSRVPHQPPRKQFATAADALLPIKDAQAAAWLLDQLHIGALSGPGLVSTLGGSFDSQPPEELRDCLTCIATRALVENLAEARGALESAAAPKAVA